MSKKIPTLDEIDKQILIELNNNYLKNLAENTTNDKKKIKKTKILNIFDKYSYLNANKLNIDNTDNNSNYSNYSNNSNYSDNSNNSNNSNSNNNKMEYNKIDKKKENNLKNKKLHIVLDLDQTLISAEAAEEHDFKKYRKKSKLFDYKDMDGYYIVYERPGLQKFLDHIFKNYIVSIWTAATKDYAIYVIEKIILKNKNRKLHYIFFSYHCDVSYHHKNKSKDLSILWDVYKLNEFNKNNTIILDDYDEVYQTQPDNCILAVPFEFTQNNSEKDQYLLNLIPELTEIQKKLNNENNVNTENANNKLAIELIEKAKINKKIKKAKSRKRKKKNKY
jgi:hypothetical protein